MKMLQPKHNLNIYLCMELLMVTMFFFRCYIAIVQLLIESSRWIGCIPPEVCSLSETIREDLAHTPDTETVLGEAKGHDLPSRYLSNKDKKQRTSSLSGT